MVEIKISEYRSEDIVALRDLFFNVRKEKFYWARPDSFNLQDFDKSTRGEYILVATYNEAIVGFISVWLPDSFIHHLYVDTKLQGVGIGTSLLKEVINKIGLPVRLKCIDKNVKAMAFYEKNGFIKTGGGVAEEENYSLLELPN